MWKCLPSLRSYQGATARVAATQWDLLRRNLSRNRGTVYGRRFQFSEIKSAAEYQQVVPVRSYHELEPYVERIAGGELHVLTSDRVRLLEPTSGTTGGEKLIPYTRRLRREFQWAVSAWMADLLWHRPELRSGRAYWSISPAFGGNRRTSGGIPIGFDDDASYLGGIDQWLVRQLLVADTQLSRTPDLTEFRYATLLALLKAEDLALISIWNPTFLTVLLPLLSTWGERLTEDIRLGTFRPPTRPQSCEFGRGDAVTRSTEGRRQVQPLAKRAAQIADALQRSSTLPHQLAQIWPRLRLISCWTDAAAATQADALGALFPGVEIQGKGLLATECCVSFPLTGMRAPALALRSTFFEFEPVELPPGADAGSDDNSRSAGFTAAVSSAVRGTESHHPVRPQLAHQLDLGQRYRLIVTTGGGLYRYPLGDEVAVAGFDGRNPLIRFLGKSDCTSDMVGEKLAETHVRRVIETACDACLGFRPPFAMLLPVSKPPRRYQLVVQAAGETPSPLVLQKFANQVHERLEDNPHYRYAVGLEQLDPLEVVWCRPVPSAMDVFQRRCLELGRKLGEVKPSAVALGDGWDGLFDALESSRLIARQSRSKT